MLATTDQFSAPSSEGRHSARRLGREVVVYYAFHPLHGRTALVVADFVHDREHYFSLSVPGGSTKPEMVAMLSAAFPKPPNVELKDSWRALPVAVEAIYVHCAPTRFNPAAPANEG